MPKVEVFHSGEHVANVNVPEGMNAEDALEYAWRWTNNVAGSWSIKEKNFGNDIDGEKNGDYNENVEVVAPLRNYNGRLMGHRSSMVGDVFKLDGVPYNVASFGFEKVENA
jgi:hypothetical protein